MTTTAGADGLAVTVVVSDGLPVSFHASSVIRQRVDSDATGEFDV